MNKLVTTCILQVLIKNISLVLFPCIGLLKCEQFARSKRKIEVLTVKFYI